MSTVNYGKSRLFRKLKVKSYQLKKAMIKFVAYIEQPSTYKALFKFFLALILTLGVSYSMLISFANKDYETAQLKFEVIQSQQNKLKAVVCDKKDKNPMSCLLKSFEQIECATLSGDIQTKCQRAKYQEFDQGALSNIVFNYISLIVLLLSFICPCIVHAWFKDALKVKGNGHCYISFLAISTVLPFYVLLYLIYYQ